MTPKFQLGRIVATPAALVALEESGQTPDFFLERHATGSWGDVDAEDWSANNQAILDGSRIFSVYKTLRGKRIWIITEATDDQGNRAATTILLPDDY